VGVEASDKSSRISTPQITATDDSKVGEALTSSQLQCLSESRPTFQEFKEREPVPSVEASAKSSRNVSVMDWEELEKPVDNAVVRVEKKVGVVSYRRRLFRPFR
jgi:hypothetical protein